MTVSNPNPQGAIRSVLVYAGRDPNPSSISVSVRVNDAELAALVGSYNGMESVFARIPTPSGNFIRVPLSFVAYQSSQNDELFAANVPVENRDHFQQLMDRGVAIEIEVPNRESVHAQHPDQNFTPWHQPYGDPDNS